jgi:hypothetical protein
MYHYDGEVLNGCAFIDADFYIVTMSSVKNFLVVGDLCKSITLVYWDHEFQQLITASVTVCAAALCWAWEVS